MDETLVFHLREARRKAKDCAEAEAVGLLNDLHAKALPGGPMAERGGVFWIGLPEEALPEALERLPRLGCSYAVDQLEPAEGQLPRNTRKFSPQVVRWRNHSYRLVRVYEDVPEGAPERRVLAPARPGGPRVPRGNRGEVIPLGQRALAVCDARLLVNLVHSTPGSVLLDPFAGTGHIVVEALASGYRVLSSDIDPARRPGLESLGAEHHVADARQLPLADASVDLVAAELPFDESAQEAVCASLAEMRRVVKPEGKISMLGAARQAAGLRASATALGFLTELDLALNRKELECRVWVWTCARSSLTPNP